MIKVTIFAFSCLLVFGYTIDSLGGVGTISNGISPTPQQILPRPSNKKKSSELLNLVIDTDAGGDDAVALILALAAERYLRHKVRILAITCTYGNTDELNVEQNVLKILTIAKRHDIPVYRGADTNILQTFMATDYFGKDGFGDFEFPYRISGNGIYKKPAAVLMTELAKKYVGELTIIALGPLTNVLLAGSLDPSFMTNVKQFYTMGPPLNTFNQTEKLKVGFNYGLDPESVRVLLNSRLARPAIMTSWDAVIAHPISKSWRTDVLGKIRSRTMNILNQAEKISMTHSDQWLPADSIVVATAIWPEMITNMTMEHAEILTCGEDRGALLIGSNDTSNLIIKNVNIINSFNLTMFQMKLLKYLQN